MSWLARSIANTLRLDNEDDDDFPFSNAGVPAKAEQNDLVDSPSQSGSPSAGRGVKEDLSELTKTLSRQFWGVASFLAPPPETDSNGKPRGPCDPDNSEDVAGIAGIRNDFVEIGGRFRSGISKLSNNIAVSEFTKMASNFLQLSPEEHADLVRGTAVGVTEELVAFARDIAMHPETWVDFPLPEDKDDEDFDMSDAQQEHALAVERLAPRLAALRIELCPTYMSERCFWKIYFVLVHPRLGKQDAEVLSTPQVMKARALLTLVLRNHSAKPEKDGYASTSSSKDIRNWTHEESLSVSSGAQSESLPLEAAALEKATSGTTTDIVTEKHTVQSTEIQIIDKAVIKDGPLNKTIDRISDPSLSFKGDEGDDDDGDDWLKEEGSETAGGSGATIPIENEEDISFSDLEEDDGDMHMSYKKSTYNSDSSKKDSKDWVQLSRKSTDSTKDINTVHIGRAGTEQVSICSPENKESNDWLDVDDIDVV